MLKTIFFREKKYILFLLFLLSYGLSQAQQTRTIQPGSVIINMGVTPQTYGNGLKPYGLVYNLLDIQKVPVLWSINPNKAKDGIDFSVSGNDFRGGTFVIEKQYAILSNVQAAITTFANQGVVTYTTTVPVTIPLYKEMNAFPRWVLDTDKGSIALAYLQNAGIPSTAYRYSTPAGLNNCDDLFILPHADPTWATHGRLYSWNNSIANGGNEGWMWEACHSVSVMEGLVNPLDPTQKLNFLGNDPIPSLVPFGSLAASSNTPFTYANPNDAPMQFMGILDAATKNGSERVYLPSLGGGWRPTTSVSVWDSAQSNIPANSPGKAAIIAYGYAFGDSSRGKVMYEAGHDVDTGNNTASVAAQRAMLNFYILEYKTSQGNYVTKNGYLYLSR